MTQEVETTHTALRLFLGIAPLLALPLLVAAALWGSVWTCAPLLYLTAFAALLDRVFPASGEAPVSHVFGLSVPMILGLAHFVILPLATVSVASWPMAPWERAFLFLSFAVFFGKVGMANAHELIHRKGVLRPALGRWILVSMLFGHHASAHPAIHHRYVATPRDPNSARLNEGFWHFFLRAWRGSFRAGLKVEITRLSQRGKPALHPSNPYITYILGAIATLALAGQLAGIRGIAVLLGYAGFAQTFLLLSDYVQHYGLRRRQLEDGSFEAVSDRHSWNARQAFSGAMMLNAPLHSMHHTRPSLSHDQLGLPDRSEAPFLPASLPVMSGIALFPPLWKRIMNPRVAAWERQARVS